METLFKELEKNENCILSQIDEIRDEYLSKGYVILEQLFSEEFCNSLKSKIDNFEQEVEVSGVKMKGKEYGYAKTEMRIWNSENRDLLLEKYNKLCDTLASKIFNQETKAFNLLCMRNKPLGPNELKEYSGRWHLDSLRDQFKSILFLTKTTEKSGPFEFIPGTQKSGFKNKLLVKGKLITLSDLINGTRSYQKLADEYIDKILKEKDSLRVIVPAGSLVFVNTSAIHRAKPCVEDGRYAIFSYYK